MLTRHGLRTARSWRMSLIVAGTIRCGYWILPVERDGRLRPRRAMPQRLFGNRPEKTSSLFRVQRRYRSNRRSVLFQRLAAIREQSFLRERRG